MKNKISLLMLLLLVFSFALFSCGGGEGDGEKPDGGDGGNTAGTDEYADYVFGGDAAPVLIIDRSVSTSVVNKIYAGIRNAYGSAPEYYYADDEDLPETSAHEIIIGNTSRSATTKAMRELRSESDTNGEYDATYLFYAMGNNVAIVFSDDADGLAAERAAEKFTAEYLKENTLKFKSGVVFTETFDSLDFYRESDAKYYEQKWAALENSIGGELGAEIVAAFKEMYKIYNHDVVKWFANLYDPAVGGFYYSNSARDNGTYAPDTESTAQALGFVGNLGKVRAWRTGMASGYAYTLSDKRKDEIRVYIKSLQDPNGFFYNYQWDKSATDAHTSRRARDLGSCIGILSTLGAKPTYTTPTGTAGDGIVVEGTYDPTILMNAPNRVGTSSTVAVSKVVLAASYAPQFENQDSLREYLRQFELTGNSFYSIGNTMTSQMGQVTARDKTLRDQFYKDPANEGKNYESLCTIIIEWFNKHQDPDTGLWGHGAKQEANYGGVNGLLKISGVYNSANAEIPYAEKAAKAAIDAITSDEVMGAVVDLYNTWFSVSNVLTNLRKYGSSTEIDGKLMTGSERAAKIIKDLRAIAAPAIIKSGIKISDFEKDDGSYSYTKRASSNTSQGMPVAVPGTNEGDVNATVISTNGLVGNIYEALDLPMVSIYGETDLRIFLDIFENVTPVIKVTPLVPLDDVPVGFDDATVGDDYCDLTVNMPEGGVIVEKDTREGREGNVIRVTGGSGSGGNVISRNNAADKRGNCAIFEAEICVHSQGTNKAYAFQITLGSSYMFDLDVNANGVTIREATTTSWGTSRYTDAATVPLDEWFKVRVEFYKYGYQDEQRALIYVNDELKIVTNGYYGYNKKTGGGTVNRGAVSTTNIYKMMSAVVNVSFDNVYTTTTNDEYKVPVDPEGKIVYNIDKDVVQQETPEP